MNSPELPKIDEQLFELDRALSDPVMVRTLAMAKYWDEQLKQGLVGDNDFGALIEMLDNEWEPFLREQVLVSGQLIYQVGEEPEHLVVSEYPALSGGFSILPAIRDQYGQLMSQYSYPTIRHHLYLQANKLEGLEDQADDEYVPAYANLDLHMEPMSFSFDRAESWLSTSFPEFKNEIDTIIAEAKGDEVALFMALKSTIPPEHMMESDDTAKRCLLRYIGEFIQIDDDVPYEVTFYYTKTVTETDVSIANLVKVSTNVFKPSGVGIDTVRMGGHDSYWSFSLIGNIHGPDKKYSPVHISLPLPLVIDIEALRVTRTDNTYLEILP